MKHVLLLATAMLFCVHPLHAQDVRVQAGFTEARIAIGATTTLFVEVETRGGEPDEIRVPDLPRNLVVVGTSEYTQTQISIPGGRTRITRRDISVVARAPGTYEVAPVIVRVDGRAYRTQPLRLTVSGTLPDAGSGRSSLVVRVEPDTVYVGQQVLLQAEVTFAEEFRNRQGRAASFEPPAPAGFWVQDLPDPITINLRVREGRTVETQTYSRAYFPLAPGEFSIPPARLHYEIRRGFGYPPEPRELISDSTPVVVLPVPASGRPAAYNGAVGRLSMTATLDADTVAVGQPAMLTVVLEGTGNVKALPAPELPDVQDVEVFPPSQESSLDVSGYTVGGRKQFRWMLVPQHTGTVVIPPFEYAAFDPERRAFITLRTDSLSLHVGSGIIARRDDEGTLRGARMHRSAARLEWVDSPWFVVAQLVPLLALIGLLTRGTRPAHDPANNDRIAAVRRELSELSAAPADAAWVARVEYVICDVVNDVAGASAEDPASLRNRGFGSTADMLPAALATLRRMRYAPDARPDAPEVMRNAHRVIDALEKDLAGSTATNTAAVLILVALAASAMPATAQDETRAAFDDAVAQMQNGDWVGAANAFARWTRENPEEPDGWYNYGVASIRAGDTGRAAWAWLRAARLAPRDADVLHNLDVIGAASAARAVRPLDLLDDRERRLLAAAGWWVLLAGIALLRFRREHAARRQRIAGIALTAAGTIVLLATATAAVREAVRPANVVALGDGVPVMAGPAIREDTVQVLRPGELARIVDRQQEWLRVSMPDGTQGWVTRRGVATP